MNPIKEYEELATKYQQKTKALQQQLNTISFIRLLSFIALIFSIYQLISTHNLWCWIAIIGCFAAFLLLIHYYERVKKQKQFYTALVKVNKQEIAFLHSGVNNYDNGTTYTNPQHPYSYDLDLFGVGGLYPYLNRTATLFGKEALTGLLLHPDNSSITRRQDAVKELTHNLNFRQQILAQGIMYATKEKDIARLKTWISMPPVLSSNILYYSLLLFPLLTISALVTYWITAQEAALRIFYTLFSFNILIAFSFAKKITSHLNLSSSITKALQQFAGQLELIEKTSWQSPLLKELQEQVNTSNFSAGKSITRLASLFNYLETIINLVVSILLNGFFLFHLHVLRRLEQWKKEHGQNILSWLTVIGEFEALNSLGNLAYNNPNTYNYPVISKEETLDIVNMGHPLINPNKRICNSISFSKQQFVILTGSNMSGKSTFLRTTGINLILAKAGAPVCAEKFICYPFSIHVSMRISDSLQDSESFFYAELKRLRAIIDELRGGEKVFVILDEILRGTNSNDKTSGTIGLIKKLQQEKAFGIIATHDLAVASLTNQYPEYLNNKCFESAIINDELLFDYKIKDGVCNKLSASFLMKKMGITD